jgi:glycosyltransferase involved in cell wall biosynthesis
VRIGLDMRPLEAPLATQRAMGRYARLLVSALLARDDAREYVLYVREGLPDHLASASPRAVVRRVGTETRRDDRTSVAGIDLVARTNPDLLDVLVVLDPFTAGSRDLPPARSADGVKIAAVVYGLERFSSQESAVFDASLPLDYHRLAELRRYDLLLAIAPETREDCMRLLAFDPARVKTLRPAADGYLFAPRDVSDPREDRKSTARLGIHSPFVLFGGSADDRNGTAILVDACVHLPDRVRDGLRVVVAAEVRPRDWDAIRRRAESCGVGRALAATGPLTVEATRFLYQSCSAFVVPPRETNVVPTLEAMLCGAPVIAGQASAHAAVVGDAGILLNISDSRELAGGLGRLLTQNALRTDLGARAVSRARAFDGDSAAREFLAALEGLETRAPRRRLRVDRGHSDRPRIAFFSPLPPKKTGVSDYAANLVQELSKTYAVDLFHDTGYVPDIALGSDDWFACDARLFGRYAEVRNYHGVVYQMGNSSYHDFLYPWIERHAGVVTLHDFSLAGFHLHHGSTLGREREFIRDELLRWYPGQVSEIVACLRKWGWDWDRVALGCVQKGWSLNRSVLKASRAVVVHSPWCLDRLRDSCPELAGHVEVIPHGIHLRETSAGQKAAIRERFGLPRDALIVASFGFLDPNKLHVEAVQAFAEVARSDGSALFLFVGEDSDGGQSRRRILQSGLSERVRFLGRRSWEDFADLIAVTDLGVNLRRPPTNGETSGALLNMLAAGVPTVVTDVATFSDYPDDVVRKVRWDSEGVEGLKRALTELAGDAGARRALGRAASAHVHEHNEWSHVARTYVEVIERSRQRPAYDARPRLVRSSQRLEPSTKSPPSASVSSSFRQWQA